MNEYIVSVHYWPSFVGKDKIIRVQTDLSKREICRHFLELEQLENELYEVFVDIQTLEEYLSDIEFIKIYDHEIK